MAARITEDSPEFTIALEQWRSRTVMPTDKSSVEIGDMWRWMKSRPSRRQAVVLKDLARQTRQLAVFSARTTNAAYLGEIAEVVDDLLSGRTDMATGRLRLLRKLKELGYDPETGFPGDFAKVPPAARGSLRDLSSEKRLKLVLETNMRMAANFGRMIEGNAPYARHAYPAWELVRLYHRDVPRGTPESHTVGWNRRWWDAGQSVSWEGAHRTQMIALKDSPIWAALGDGAGGYEDSLGNPYPPFAFQSGMAWRAVPRALCIELGLVSGDEVPEPMNAQLTPDERRVNDIFGGLPADLQAELRRELADDTERERLRVSREEFARRERAAAAERRGRLGEIRDQHRAFVEGLMR